MPFFNRVRLPIMFAKPQYPMERNVFRKSDGSTKVLSMVIRNTFEGKTDQLPEAWHRKLVIAMAHDTVNVENERLLSGVALDGDYAIDWQDFLNYPIAQATFSVQVTPFDATNSNCQTCDEMTQLNLVDDTTTDIWSEGTTNEFPDVLTANDSICCYPFVITLVSYNTLYFSSVTIDTDGVLTATVLAEVAPASGILIATYRVTCPDGSYDEANVYGNVTGSLTCESPGGLDTVVNPLDDTVITIIWDESAYVPVCGFNWELYLSTDLVTPVQSGNTSSRFKALTGLTPGASYVFIVTSDCCAYDYSVPSQIEFTQIQNFGDSCGSFTVTYLPNIDAAPQSISYMNCAGNVINTPLTFAQELTICMLITPGLETPIYFVASSVDISITYTALCE